MNILEKRNINSDTYDYIKSLQFKNNHIDLLGSGGLASQEYTSDIDLFSLIESRETRQSVNKTIKNILQNTLKNENMYLIEIKIQYKDDTKEKFYNINDFKLDKPLIKVDFIKIDYVIFIDNIFKELSIIYSFNNVVDVKQIQKKLVDDIKELYKDGNYYKVVKRLFSLYKIEQKNIPLLVIMTKFFNSNIGKLYQRVSQLKAIKLLKEHHNDDVINKKVDITLSDLNVPKNISLDKIIKDEDIIINKAGKDFLKEYKLWKE
jgi:hypothetical protein